MIMGNYLAFGGELSPVMATKQTVGMNHLTVVPANFDRDDSSSADDDRAEPEQ
ncbi:hypothetical protein LC1Hm_2349 [Halomicrobium sp. LC1Hm]|nr:hypothetical protein LC1Hm_2349 [Halomicrobium sp. LC1Hm]